MFLVYPTIMALWLLFLGKAASWPASEEYQGIVRNGESGGWSEFIIPDDTHTKYIMPGFLPEPQKEVKLEMEDLYNKDNEYYKILTEQIELGNTMRGLTFTIYDDNMREAAIALFRLMESVEENNFNIVREWANKYVNKDILDYTLRLALVHRGDDAVDDLDPHFMMQPNYFVNTETIQKALKLKLKNDRIYPEEGKILQMYKDEDLLVINANYSGWNTWNEDCRDQLDYFRQDIGLNSYYYGLHLQFPFWMSNHELSATDSRYAENYYYGHKYLIARINMEMEHLKQRNISTESKCYDEFNPYLSYENGLPFPSRSSIRMEWNEEYARIKSIDLAIKECITRGVIFMENGTKVDLTENNYIDLLTKLIRANYENENTAKLIRSLVGYGSIGNLSDSYNPAPSVLHHPQTSLRDPIYWRMIENMLKYFSEYSSTLEPYDFSIYQSDDVDIIDNSFTKITTYFDYYDISINNIFENYDYRTAEYVYAARQKRIQHLPFTLAFTAMSKVNKTSLIKLFLGPSCQEDSCWDKFSQFYELDMFTENLEEGLNIIKWSSSLSKRYSIEDYYNVELKSARNNRFNMLKLPQTLMIPRGLNEGLNLTLFVIILPMNDNFEPDYNKEPLGFPFHRQAKINTTDFNNYKFYNVSIFHKKNMRQSEGYYSPHLD